METRTVENRQLCGEAVAYKAFQRGNRIMIFVSGWHGTAGYDVALNQKQIEVFPPQFALTDLKPPGPAAQVITPFAVTTSFISMEQIEEVIVHDAKGSHKIKVQQSKTGEIFDY